MIHLLIEYLKPTSSEKAMPLRSFAAQIKKGSDLRNTQNENPWTSLVLSPFSRKLTFCLLPLPKPNIQTSLQSPPLGLPDLKEFGSLQPWHFHGEEIRLATAISPIWVETLKDLEKHTPLVALTLHTKIVADMLLILRKALWPKHELICVNLCLWILNISQPAHWQIWEPQLMRIWHLSCCFSCLVSLWYFLLLEEKPIWFGKERILSAFFSGVLLSDEQRLRQASKSKISMAVAWLVQKSEERGEHVCRISIFSQKGLRTVWLMDTILVRRHYLNWSATVAFLHQQ